MKATFLLLGPIAILSSCSNFGNQNNDPVAPPVATGNQYGVPPANPPYQPVDPINPPAATPPGYAPVAPATPPPGYVPVAPATPAPATPVPTPNPGTDLTGNTYKIAEGDSLWGIAKKFGVSVAELKQANNLTDDNIWAGKTLIIPGR